MPRAIQSNPCDPVLRMLTDALAVTVMGWRATPDRFLTSYRGWIPRWRFSPFEEIEDAFLLLKRASSYRLRWLDGLLMASVRIGNRTGCAHGSSEPKTISLAVAKAAGLKVPDAI
jgi:hypothetical protein